MSGIDTLSEVKPSATPTDAERAAWQTLPRDVQLLRLREALAHADCSTSSTSSMSDILVRAQAAAKQQHG